MSHSRRIPAAVAVWLSLAGLVTVQADEPARRSGAAPSDPAFTALLVDGTSLSGRMSKLGAEGVTLSVENEDRPLAWNKLVRLTREGPTPPYPPEGTLVLFPEGDRLRAVIGVASDTALETRSYLLGDVSIPLESLLGVVLAPPSEPEAFEKLVRRVREQPRTKEMLWLANGDRQTGGFLGLSARQVSLQGDAGAIEVDRSQVVALGFDPALVAYPAPKETFVEITLTDGSRLGITGFQAEKAQLAATTRWGAKIRLALSDLARIHVRNSSLVYLSERKADATEYVGYIGPTRHYQRDAAVDGLALRLGGQAYDRGLGTESRTILAYRLAASDRRFQALVGLDDRAGPLGSVVFRVRVDRDDKFVSPEMSVRDTPKMVDVDVSGGKILFLITEFGERGNVRDFADWVEARLIR